MSRSLAARLSRIEEATSDAGTVYCWEHIDGTVDLPPPRDGRRVVIYRWARPGEDAVMDPSR